MRDLKPNAASVINKNNPEWGAWGISKDCGEWYEILGKGRTTVLFKDEAEKFWEVNKIDSQENLLKQKAREILQNCTNLIDTAIETALNKTFKRSRNGYDFLQKISDNYCA